MSSLKELKQEYIEGIKEEIKANQTHIELLEKFLFNDCEKMPLDDSIKLKVFDYANKGKAPFHNSKNNTNDAAILFSVPYYFKDHFWRYGDSILFISNNTSEFTDKKDESTFHPDIIEHLGTFEIQFCSRLPDALKISVEIIQEIDSYTKNKIVTSEPVDCMMSFCRLENLELDGDLRVNYQADEDYDPKQLSLFPQFVKKTRRSFVSYVNCPRCETLHFQCPRCMEVTVVDDVPNFYCKSCASKLSLREDNKTGDWTLYVYNSYNLEVDDLEKESEEFY